MNKNIYNKKYQSTVCKDSHSDCTSISEEEVRKVEVHESYLYFADAYDDVDVSKLSDKDLQQFRDMCENGLSEAHRELCKRKL